eukprot:RCo016928
MATSARQRASSKLRQDVQALVHQEGNDVCMDCGTKGPQYVVLDFNTFVCSDCSVQHRILHHNVKGLSTSPFTEEELAALRGGGNTKALKIWRAFWRQELQPLPKKGDDKAVAQFIKMTYIEKKWKSKDAPA